MFCFLSACAFDGGHNGLSWKRLQSLVIAKGSVMTVVSADQEEEWYSCTEHKPAGRKPSLYIPLTLISFLRKCSQCAFPDAVSPRLCHPLPRPVDTSRQTTFDSPEHKIGGGGTNLICHVQFN